MNSIICSWKKNGILATILLSLFSWILLTWHIIQIALHLILIMFWLLFVLKKQLMLRARKIQLDIGNNNDKCRFFERNEYSHYMKFWSIRLSSIFFLLEQNTIRTKSQCSSIWTSSSITTCFWKKQCLSQFSTRKVYVVIICEANNIHFSWKSYFNFNFIMCLKLLLVINGERASYFAKEIRSGLDRTRKEFLLDWERRYSQNK